MNNILNPHELLRNLISFAINKVPLHKQLLLVRMQYKSSQKQLAKDLGCDQAAVSVIESGKRGLTVRQVERYADVFGLQTILVPKLLVMFVAMVLRVYYEAEQKIENAKKQPASKPKRKVTKKRK